MDYRSLFEAWFVNLHVQFSTHEVFQTLLSKKDQLLARNLIENVCKAHLCSPQILGFLFSIAPPKSIMHIQHNLLEELGLEEGDTSHPDLLRRLAEAVPFSSAEWLQLELDSNQVLKNKVTEPLMFGSIRDVGLGVLLEVFGFEWFLAREASRMGEAIQMALEFDSQALEWFFHHSEVDIAHAEQGLDTLVEYVDYYDLDSETVKNIGEITFRSNVFLKRYFDVQIEAIL